MKNDYHFSNQSTMSQNALKPWDINNEDLINNIKFNRLNPAKRIE